MQFFLLNTYINVYKIWCPYPDIIEMTVTAYAQHLTVQQQSIFNYFLLFVDLRISDSYIAEILRKFFHNRNKENYKIGSKIPKDL